MNQGTNGQSGAEAWVERTLAAMSLREKVGQLFCPIMMPETLRAEQQIEAYAVRVREEALEFKPGGYYLNRYYRESTPLIIHLVQQSAAIPLLITSDMEAGAGGGLGGVIAPGMTQFPPAMAIGATGYEPYAYQVGLQTALQALDLGVNFIFAPVLDVNNNPKNPIINVRSFSEDPECVARMGGAMINGLRDGGVAGCAKHFPGHGDVSVDTHLQLARIDADINRLERVELYPYRRLIENPGIDAIMTAHIAAPALDPDENLPATLSKRILTGFLREEMEFDGVIVTDALLMGAITTIMDPAEAAVRALEAGADWLLLPPDFPAAFNAVLQAVESGRLSEERIDDSVWRILALKSDIDLEDGCLIETSAFIHELNIEEAQPICDAICADAVTLLRDKAGALPLDELQIISAVIYFDRVDEYCDLGNDFFDSLATELLDLRSAVITPESGKEEYAEARTSIKNADAVIFGVVTQVVPDNPALDVPDEYVKLVNAALKEKKQTIIVDFGSPYLSERFAKAPTFICAYGYIPAMCQAVADVLFGVRRPGGNLPVTIA